MLEELYQITLGFKEDLIQLLPKLITSLIVLVLGYLLALLFKYLIIKLILSLDNVVRQRFKNIDLKQSATFMGAAFFWLILLSTFFLITDILGLTIITSGIEGIIKYTPNILAAILILLAANILARFIAETIYAVSTRAGFAYGNMLGKAAQLLIILTAIIIVADQLGIEVAFLINLIDICLAALFFGAALAFGLGSRAAVSNILATFYVRKFYKEGDLIRIGEIEGRIAKIESTAVLLDTERGRYAVPAKEFNETKSLLIKEKS